jgi:hypothetical protein
MLPYEKTVPSGGKYMRSYNFLLDFSVSPDGGTSLPSHALCQTCNENALMMSVRNMVQ